MQPWDQVKVNKKGSEHDGRAGLVTGVTGDKVEVKLDETETHEQGTEVFAESDLTHLGR